MPRPPERAESGRVARFTPAEHRVHRATATLMALCVLTAGCLYLPFLAELVGRRALMVTLHEWSGILLPVPLLLGLASRALRADLTRLNRYGPHDRHWLRASLRRRRHRTRARTAGKFNAGQKVYAGWITGAVLVMICTGLLMWFTHLAPLVWRTGATFVHDWLALAVVIVVAGHIWMAFGDPESRRGMRTGYVDADWARREHPLWDHGKDHRSRGSGQEAGRGGGESHGEGGAP
jgi:formate dehydrogenase subunit gamma